MRVLGGQLLISAIVEAGKHFAAEELSGDWDGCGSPCYRRGLKAEIHTETGQADEFGHPTLLSHGRAVTG
jgi:hypothetical protein